MQDAAVALWRSRSDGSEIANPLAFCSCVVRRRVSDEVRRVRRCTLADEHLLAAHARAHEPVVEREYPWRDLMLTRGQLTLLRLIVGGVRSTRSLARALDRDPASVRERRHRLVSHLERLWARAGAPLADPAQPAQSRGIPALNPPRSAD